ncbi:MAG: DNA translocase FtsK 4TM domain-containing protein [Gammaproteobacteria bacterium]|nr:DNA translocase FtsK 4TM domain-containing protein [Gammaproteobacteria bacterium]MBV9619570.1 DNA translocase FtsK 4TM domain-containing protein [Gammaproteobacteria bacterium]
MSRGLRESAVIAIAIVALVVLTALLSYSPQDPGFSFTGGAAPVHNRIGVVGAWLADVLFFLFGRPAFLLPLVLGFAGWALQRRIRAESSSRANTLVRIGGFVLLLIASCALTTLHWQPGLLRQTAGGVVGSMVGGGLAAGLNFLGATLLLIAAWMAGLSLAFGVSWFTVMDQLGALTWRGIRWLRSRPASSRDAAEGRERRQARKEAVQSEQRKTASRAPPRIEAPTPGVEKSARVERERQVPLFDPPKASELPPLKLLDDPPPREPLYSAEALEALSRLVEMKLKDFAIDAEVVAVQPGPVVTRFELRPAPGVKASQITALAKDLARALSVLSVRVVEVIPGKSVMGLEIANEKREVVTLGEIIRSKAYDEMHSPLALALGKDIGGQPMVADLTRMPHLLIAGTTGSGKSVGINAMVLSLLYKSTAEHVRLIMIDPKMLELSVYEGIPHLLAPVVTDMKQAANALRWCVAEMERRYQLMAALGVRNISGFNRRVKEASDEGKPIRDPLLMQRAANDPSIDQREIPDLTPLPYVVVVVDELADLMMIVGKKVEELITRLAQKARASGLHLVLATQRPSVDVITGLIKANIPCRIAFQVSARVDSRTILDQMGAETLLGHGDMLYLPPGTSLPIRVHGAFVSDQEVHRVVEALKTATPPSYLEEVLSGPSAPIPGLAGEETETGAGGAEGDAEQDPLYDEAVRIVTSERKPSISYVQRRLKIGYNRAARLLEAMEIAGLVGPLQANGARDVLAPAPPED